MENCHHNFMIPGSKGLNPHELAHRWVNDLVTPTSFYIKMHKMIDITAIILYNLFNLLSRYYVKVKKCVA